jgi:hypothetical protein
MSNQNQESFFNNFNNQQRNNLIDTSLNSPGRQTLAQQQQQALSYQQPNSYSNNGVTNPQQPNDMTNSFWQNQFNNGATNNNAVSTTISPMPPQSQAVVSPLQTNNDNNNTVGKRKFGTKKEFFAANKLKKQKGEGGIVFKKPKPPKIPVYKADIQPAQLLNELHSNLIFVFTEMPLPSQRIKYTCTVDIKLKQANQSNAADSTTQMSGLLDHQQRQLLMSDMASEFKFSGDGWSKREAKKNCSHIALMGLYTDSYSAPASEYTCATIESQSGSGNKPNHLKQNPLEQIKLNDPNATSQATAGLNKRLEKLINSTEKLKNKSPAQLLHELSAKIAETGKCITESGVIPDKKFCFQFKNIKEQSCVKSDFTTDDIYSDMQNDANLDDLTKFAHGFGKSKKEAKNQGARNALKQFFSLDMTQVHIPKASPKVNIYSQ